MDTMDTDLFCPVNRSLLYDEIVDSFSRLFGNGFANANANANANACLLYTSPSPRDS